MRGYGLVSNKPKPGHHGSCFCKDLTTLAAGTTIIAMLFIVERKAFYALGVGIKLGKKSVLNLFFRLTSWRVN